MFKTVNKETTSAPSSASTSVSSSSNLSSKTGKLRVTPEGGLSLVGDGGVLGKVSSSTAQPGQKQKFFATRSADGKWNLLMAPSSDPSRLFLVQPAPGHKFQVESINSAASDASGKATSSNGCEKEQQSQNISSAESSESGVSKSVAVPVVLSSTNCSPLSSPHTTTATTPINVETTTTASSVLCSSSAPEQKKPSFFKSRTASDREALKAQHLAGQKVLTAPKKNSKTASHSSKKGKGGGKSTGSPRSHRKKSPLPAPVQDSMSECFSHMSVSLSENCADTSVAVTAMSTTALTAVTTTTSSLLTSTTSLSSPASCDIGVTPSIEHALCSSPSRSPLQHAEFDTSLSAGPHNTDLEVSELSTQSRDRTSSAAVDQEISETPNLNRSRTSSTDADGHDGASAPCPGSEIAVSGNISSGTVSKGNKLSCESHSEKKDVLSSDENSSKLEEEQTQSIEQSDTLKITPESNLTAENDACLNRNSTTSEQCTLAHEQRHFMEEEDCHNGTNVSLLCDPGKDDVDERRDENSTQEDSDAIKKPKDMISSKSSTSHASRNTSDCAAEMSDVVMSGQGGLCRAADKQEDDLKKVTTPHSDCVSDSGGKDFRRKRRKTGERVAGQNSSDTDDYEFASSVSESEIRKRRLTEQARKDSDDSCLGKEGGEGISEHTSTPCDEHVDTDQTCLKEGKDKAKRKVPSRKLTRNRGQKVELLSTQSVKESNSTSDCRSGLETNTEIHKTFDSGNGQEKHVSGDEGTIDSVDELSAQQTDSVHLEKKSCQESDKQSYQESDQQFCQVSDQKSGQVSDQKSGQEPDQKSTLKSDKKSGQESDSISGEASEPVLKDTDKMDTWMVAGNQTDKPKKKPKKNRELDALLEMNSQDRGMEVLEFSRKSRANTDLLNPWSVSFTEEPRSKKKRKKPSEETMLLETQEAESGKDTQTLESASQQDSVSLVSLEERTSFTEESRSKKKRKKPSEDKMLLETQEAESGKDTQTLDSVSQQDSVSLEERTSCTEESRSKKKRKKPSEDKMLLETQEAESGKDTQTLESASQQDSVSLVSLEERTDVKNSHSTPESHAIDVSESTMTYKEKKHKKKKKKKEQLKILINLNEANKKDDANDRISELTKPGNDVTPAEELKLSIPRDSAEPEKVQNQDTQKKSLDRELEDTVTVDVTDQSMTDVDKQTSGSRDPAISDRLFQGDDTTVVHVKKVKKKKKNKKLKIVFGSGQEASTRDIPISVNPNPNACAEPESVLGAAESFSGNSQETSTQEIPINTNPSPSASADPETVSGCGELSSSSGQETSSKEVPICASPNLSARAEPETVSGVAESFDSISETLEGSVSAQRNSYEEGLGDKSNKKRKKRLTELETLIHDQESLCREVPTSNERSSENILLNESVTLSETTEPGMSDKAKPNEVDESETLKNSGLEEQVENNEGNSLIPLTEKTADTEPKKKGKNENVHSVDSKDRKAKEKKKKKKKKKPSVTADAVHIVVPEVGGDEEGTDCGPAVKRQHLESTDDRDTGEEDEEASANRAMARFLTTRSFTRWELAGMFGTPFVVLERLCEQDVYFMSRRFRNARVSSRARCTKHCRLRTLDYLCEFNLLDCKPPADYKPPAQNVTQETEADSSTDNSSKQHVHDEPPKTKKRKKKDKELKEGESKAKKSKSADEIEKKVTGEKGDDVILIDNPAKSSPASPASSPFVVSTSFPSFPSATFGRLPTVRVSSTPGRPVILTSVSQPTSSVGSRVITIPSIGTSGTTPLPQVITIPPVSVTRSSSMPQVITIPSLAASRITVPPLIVNNTAASLRDATRASLTQAISNSLTRTRPVVPTSTKSPTATSSFPAVSSQLRATSLIPKGPVLIQGTSSTTATTTTTTAALSKQFYMVQMGDKRVLVPAAALCTASTAATATTSASVTSTVTATTAASLQSLVSMGAASMQRPTNTIPAVITAPTTSVRASTAVPLSPGSVARIVLSNRRSTSLTPRSPTASTLLFASPGTARPNMPWTGPRTVDSNRRFVVTPASQPQGIRVVLGAGPAATRARFSVASSRNGVFVTTRQPASLMRVGQPGQSRPGKRVMTEEERLRKRARLEKKYPLPPGVVIKTEPVTQGYGDDGKTTQAGSSGTRVFVSKMPRGLSNQTHINLSQPIPVLSALRGGPLVIRQTAPSSSAGSRASLLAPVIIRMPNASSMASTTVLGQSATSSASSVNITTPSTTAVTAAVTAVSLLNISSSQLPSTVATASPLIFSMLNTVSSDSSAVSSTGGVTVTASTSSSSSLTSLVSGTMSSTTTSSSSQAKTSNTVSSPVPAEVSDGVSGNTSQADNSDDDAIYIADSPFAPASADNDSSAVHNLADNRVTSSPAKDAPIVVTVDSPAASPTFSDPITSSVMLSVASPAVVTPVVSISPSPSVSSSASSSPVPRSSTPLLPSRMASLGALWARQAAESGSVPTISATSLQSDRMRRLKETLAKQMEGLGDERRQKALQALQQRIFKAAQASAARSDSAPPQDLCPSSSDKHSDGSSSCERDTISAERRLEGEREGNSEGAGAGKDSDSERNQDQTTKGQEATEAIVIHEDSDEDRMDAAIDERNSVDTQHAAEGSGSSSQAARCSQKERGKTGEDSAANATNVISQASDEVREEGGGSESEMREDYEGIASNSPSRFDNGESEGAEMSDTAALDNGDVPSGNSSADLGITETDVSDTARREAAPAEDATKEYREENAAISDSPTDHDNVDSVTGLDVTGEMTTSGSASQE